MQVMVVSLPGSASETLGELLKLQIPGFRVRTSRDAD